MVSADERAVADEARGTAGGAAPHAHIQIGQTIPAEAAGPGRIGDGHGTSRSQERSPSASPSTCRAAATLVGCSSAVDGEGLHGGVIAHHEIEHAEEEIRVGGGIAQGLRTDACLSQEQAKPLRIAGDEGERLNRNDFSDFARVVNRLFQGLGLPFR